MALFLAGADWGVRLASLDVLDLMLQASWLVKLVLLLLGLASIISWAIIAMKWRELRRAAEDSEAFLEVYHDGSLEASSDAARELPSSPVAQIFLEGYAELGRIARYAGRSVAGGLGEAQLRAFERLVDWTAARETQRLERGLEFLATTGNNAPFVGLFGTVVGIMNAFQHIGQSGSASLAVVAPGIAEALITTAVGLAVAIPSSIFYNHFVSELRRLSVSIDLFSAEFQTDLRSRGVRSGSDGARATGA